MRCFPHAISLFTAGLLSTSPSALSAQQFVKEDAPDWEYQYACTTAIDRKPEPMSFEIIEGGEENLLLDVEPTQAAEDWTLMKVRPFVGRLCTGKSASLYFRHGDGEASISSPNGPLPDHALAEDGTVILNVLVPGRVQTSLHVIGDMGGPGQRHDVKSVHSGRIGDLAVASTNHEHGTSPDDLDQIIEGTANAQRDSLRWLRLEDGRYAIALCKDDCGVLGRTPAVSLVGVWLAMDTEEISDRPLDGYALGSCAELRDEPDNHLTVLVELRPAEPRQTRWRQVPLPKAAAEGDADLCMRGRADTVWSDNTARVTAETSHLLFHWSDKKEDVEPVAIAPPPTVTTGSSGNAGPEITQRKVVPADSGKVPTTTQSATVVIRAEGLPDAAFEGEMTLTLIEGKSSKIWPLGLTPEKTIAEAEFEILPETWGRDIRCQIHSGGASRWLLKDDICLSVSDAGEIAATEQILRPTRFAMVYPVDQLSNRALVYDDSLGLRLIGGSLGEIGVAFEPLSTALRVSDDKAGLVAVIGGDDKLSELDCVLDPAALYEMDRTSCELTEVFRIGELVLRTQTLYSTQLRRRSLEVTIPVDISALPPVLQEQMQSDIANKFDGGKATLFSEQQGRRPLDEQSILFNAQELVTPLTPRNNEKLKIELTPNSPFDDWITPVALTATAKDFQFDTDNQGNIRGFWNRAPVPLVPNGLVLDLDEIRIAMYSRSDDALSPILCSDIQLSVSPEGRAYRLFQVRDGRGTRPAQTAEGLPYYQPPPDKDRNNILHVAPNSNAEVIAGAGASDCVLSGDTRLDADGRAEVAVDSARPIFAFVGTSLSGEAGTAALRSIGAVSSSDQQFFWDRMINLASIADETLSTAKGLSFERSRLHLVLQRIRGGFELIASARDGNPMFPAQSEARREDIRRATVALSGGLQDTVAAQPATLLRKMEQLRIENAINWKSQSPGDPVVSPVLAVNVRAEELGIGACNDFIELDAALSRTPADRLIVIMISPDGTLCNEHSWDRVDVLTVTREDMRTNYSSVSEAFIKTFSGALEFIDETIRSNNT